MIEDFFSDVFQNHKYTLMGLALFISMGIMPLIGKLLLKNAKKHWLTIAVIPALAAYFWWVYKVDQKSEALKYTHQAEYMVTGIFLMVTTLMLAVLYLLYHRIKQELLITDLRKDFKELNKKLDQAKYNGNV